METRSESDAAHFFDADLFSTASYDTFTFHFEEEERHQKKKIAIKISCLRFFTFYFVVSDIQSRENQHTLHSAGRVVWPAAEVLCSFLQKNKNLFHEKDVLEVGSGQGLSGMLCAHYTEKKVVLSDFDAPSIELLRDNLLSNFNEGFLVTVCLQEFIQETANRPSVVQLIWGDYSSINKLKEQFPDGFPIIIGSDIVYYKEAVRPLIQTVNELLANNADALFILCNQAGRLGVNNTLFYSSLKEFNFNIEEVALTEFMSNPPLEKIHLFLIRRPKSN